MNLHQSQERLAPCGSAGLTMSAGLHLVEADTQSEYTIGPFDYGEQRDELATTATLLLERNLNVAEAMYGAYGIVAEEVASTTVRTRLHSYFIGNSWRGLQATHSGVLNNNATTRAYVPSPFKREQMASVASAEPLVLYLSRCALQEPHAQRIGAVLTIPKYKAEEYAGALLRMFVAGTQKLNAIELSTSVAALTPQLPEAVSKLLVASHRRYSIDKTLE